MADQMTRFFVLFGGLAMMGVLVLALRWTYGTNRSQAVPPTFDPYDPTGHGLLEVVSRLPTRSAAEVVQARLTRAGIRATVGRADGAYRLLVFPADLVPAKLVVRDSTPG